MMTKEDLLKTISEIRQALQEAKDRGDKQFISQNTPRFNYYFDEYQQRFGSKED